MCGRLDGWYSLFGNATQIDREDIVNLFAELKYIDELSQSETLKGEERWRLSQDFISLLTQQKAEELSDWFRRAKQSQVAELMSLAKSLQQDSSAIAAACSLPWSQGQVEG